MLLGQRHRILMSIECKYSAYCICILQQAGNTEYGILLIKDDTEFNSEQLERI